MDEEENEEDDEVLPPPVGMEPLPVPCGGASLAFFLGGDAGDWR